MGRLLAGVLLAAASIVILKLEPWRSKQVIFTSEQLSSYDGITKAGLYLGILGEVFDVSAGSRFYSKGNGYHHFVGRDATKAFMTGEFEKDLTDDVKDFDAEKCAALIHWRGFFRNHTEYKLKGRLIGAFYDAAGHPTHELARVEKMALQAKSEEEKMKEREAQFPRCNSRWNQASGGFVWCDDGMFPRKITLSVPGGKTNQRCACFKDIGWSDVREVYPDCDPEATECRTQPPGPSTGGMERPALQVPGASDKDEF